MALLDLYDGDLSLFDRDVLASLGSPLIGEQLPLAGYDGFQTSKAESYQAETTPQHQSPEIDLFKNFGQSVEVKEASPNGMRWLDTSVDLLDLLDETQHESFSHNLCTDNSLPSCVPSYETQPTALEVLQSLADETEKELASNRSFSETASPATSPAAAVPSTASSSFEDNSEIGHSSVLMEMLLDNHSEKSQTVQHSVMDIDVDEHLVLEASAMPILSPVSLEDVESLLSSGPSSPSSVALDQSRSVTPSSDATYNPGLSSEDELSDETWVPTKQHKRSSRSAPYPRPSAGTREAKLADRKQRKKQQNRDAALRYRQKKKAEAESTDDVCTALEKRNTELKGKVDEMTREIQYLKDLMADVYRARGLKFKLPSFK